MKYTKQPLTIDEQIELLKSRGLEFNDVNEAKNSLLNISYYRLSSYLYPFRIPNDDKQRFMSGTIFEDILKFYSFDRKLRLLIFDSVERIEISVRTQLIYQLSLKHNSQWYLENSLFRNSHSFNKIIESFVQEYKNSEEIFIKHYKYKYNEPEFPPAWIGLEIFTFGQLSKHYSNLAHNNDKQSISRYFNLQHQVFESWLHSLVYVRNLCAHHSRIWNRILAIKPIIPKPKNIDWINDFNFRHDKLYLLLCIIKYFLQSAHPRNTFAQKLNNLIGQYPNIDISKMGFPDSWRNEKFWTML